MEPPLPLAPSPAEIREELQALIIGDLLGPAGGADEEIPGRERVRDRYVLGALAPKDTGAVDPERSSSEGAVEGDDSAGSGDADPAAGGRSLFPSSMGFSCAVDASVTALTAIATWGTYEKASSDAAEGERGGSIWRRSSGGGTIALPLGSEAIGPLVPDAGRPDVVIRGRVTSQGSRRLISVFLVNEQPTPLQNRDEGWLFQTVLRLEAPDGSPVFLARDRLVHATEAADPELPQLDMLYRDEVEFAVGHGTAVHATRDPGDPRRAVSVATAAVPVYDVLRTEAPSVDQVPELAGLELDMSVLAGAPDAELLAMLAPLASGYGLWLDRQERRIAAEASLAGFEGAAAEAVKEGRKALDALAGSLDLLRRDADARDAFRFANRAMWQQRIHSEAAKARRLDTALAPDQALADADIPKNRSWRPFQLAFILLNLPALTLPTHPDRVGTGLGDLLFFPTGGGKTEAYLGLTAFTLAIRRLQGVVAGRDGRDGVAVIMRYTLRLLTSQQFQRASALICACELIRREDPGLWGEAPFRIGMWVGSSVTPNRTAAAAKALEDEHGLGGRGGSKHSSPVQLVSCPWCGSDIDPANHARSDPDRWRTLVFCGDDLGRCAFTEKGSPDEGLPVITVDEEIYRLLPSLVISTADKWAMLPWRGELHLLFGRAERRCTRHGYRSPDLDVVGDKKEADKHTRTGTLPPAVTVAVTPLRPPDLIIQDELHLISGPLGTMVGLYETAIDRLASWDVDGVTVRPKLVASTATIRRAGDQVYAVFWRQTRIFPPPVLDLDDSFFAVRRPTSSVPGRRYVGICARGLRLKSAEVRVFSTVLAAAQKVYERYGIGADPWMTLVGYFNALRELGGMRRLVDDEVASRLRRADRRGLAVRKYLEVRELTSRIGSTDIPEILDQLAVKHDPGREKGSARPIDVVLATNMISVGVDVPRLGLMTVVGQPKATAEYIQATSRVGRELSGPGLVFTIYNWARPRDLSHYEGFEHYHATFYRHVEALSVTPFAPRALDRALSAIVAALVRDENPAWNPEPAAAFVDVTSARVREAIDAIARRGADVGADASLEADIRASAQTRLDAWAAKQKRPGAKLVYREEKGNAISLLEMPTGFDWQLWSAPMSMRDVEPSVNLVIRDEGRSADPEPAWYPAAAGGSAPREIDDDVPPEGGAEEPAP